MFSSIVVNLYRLFHYWIVKVYLEVFLLDHIRVVHDAYAVQLQIALQQAVVGSGGIFVNCLDDFPICGVKSRNPIMQCRRSYADEESVGREGAD